MILATIHFFNFSDLNCFAIKICVRDVICSAFRPIEFICLTKKIGNWNHSMNFKFFENFQVVPNVYVLILEY